MNIWKIIIRETIRPFRQLSQLLRKFYLWLCSHRLFQKVNSNILRLALQARGYGNYPDISESGESHFLKQIAREKPNLCIDIGANQGDYSAELLSHTASIVLAFEPQPSIFPRLREMQAQYPQRFFPVNCGVGDKTGNLDLHYGDDRSCLASFVAEINEIKSVGAVNTKIVNVPVVTLDQFLDTQTLLKLPAHIDLLKIDTEGFEMNVILGALSTISKYKPKYIQVEISLQHMYTKTTLLDLSRQLQDYTVHQILPFGLTPVDPMDPLSNIFSYSNFAFIRK
jgi:FkbM family methyltransferase